MKIEIKNLSKAYSSKKALNNVSLTLNEGIYGILGPNGSGKTTLINLLIDNVKRTSGEILLDGEEILSLGAEYRDMIGYMPQQQALYNDFSAYMYLKYMCSVKSIRHGNELISKMLKKVNLYDVRMGDFHDGLVEDFRLAEASVLVPHMNDGYVCFLAQLFDHLTRIVARTVVRNDNLGRLDCLTEYTTDTKSQRIFPVIRRD